MITEQIGIDLGDAEFTAGIDRAVAKVGARIVRLRFPLAGRSRADEAYLSAADDVVGRFAALRVRAIAVVDGSLTVAPGGLGTFDDPPADAMLAAAWSAELVANAVRLAERIGDRVAAWEVLPEPNGDAPPRIAPARWLTLIEAVGRALKTATPDVAVLAGGLRSDDREDGVEYLRAALDSVAAAAGPLAGHAPFDSVSLRVRVQGDGGVSEQAVGAALSERVQRIWRVLERYDFGPADADRGIYVTGVGWDARLCGDELQARNAWTAFNTLTVEPYVRAVCWSTLLDQGETATGLHRDATFSAASRRPAWQAVHDFVEYARMIAPTGASYAALSALVGDPDVPTADPEVPTADPGAPEGTGDVPTPATDVQEESLEAPAAGPVADAAPTAVAGAAPTSGLEPTAERTYGFTIPDAADILRSQGVAGSELQVVLAAVAKKYGGSHWLPPGEYAVVVPEATMDEQAEPCHTNQHVISAMYRAGAGTWDLLERSGLSLSDLATARHEPYAGPALGELAGLSEEERSRVRQELAKIAAV